MTELPVLVVHGGWIAKLLVVALIIAPVIALRRLRRAGRWLPAWLLVLGVASYGGLRAIGHALVGAGSSSEHDGLRDTELGALDPEVIAAALPGVRDAALHAVDARLAGLARTEAIAAQRRAVAELAGGCRAVVAREISMGNPEAALVREADCPDPGLRITALIALGRYAEATPATASRDVRAVVALATERWADAAAAIDDPGDPRARCVAELVRWFGGDAVAAARLAAGGTRDLTCAVAAWIAAPVAGRDPAALAAAVNAGRADPAWRAAADVAWAYNAPDRPDRDARDARDAIEQLLRPGLRADRRPWLAGGAAFRAVASVHRGDLAGAALAAAGDPALAGAVALRAGTPAPDPELVLAGDPICTARTTAAFTAAAQTGDGGELAELIERCRLDIRLIAAPLLAVAPRLRTHRERLASAVRAADDRAAPAPFDRVAQLALARDLARLLGEPARAAALQAIIDRQVAAFRRREQIVALVLWRG